MNKITMLLLFVMFCVSMSFAQAVDSLKHEGTERYFKYNYDNDIFDFTDRYYTQGIRIELILPVFKRSPLSKVLLQLSNNTVRYYGKALQQDCFTPADIKHDSIYFGERPYSSVFFVSSFLISVNKIKQERLTSQLDLGVIGPNAYGKQGQTWIHETFGNDKPLGWQYQIANDAVINYTLNYERGLAINKNIELIGMLEARAGSLYDDVSMGTTLRIGRMHNYFDDLGLSNNNSGNGKFQCYLLLGEKAKIVGYNATLQGGVFNRKSIYTIPVKDVKRVVGSVYLGLTLAYKRLSINFTRTFISAEFYNGLDHSWGHWNISYCF